MGLETDADKGDKMMNALTDKLVYQVRFVVYEEDCMSDKYMAEYEFFTGEPEHVKGIISALAAFHSGDDCECFINGELALLKDDWGLL